VANKEIIWFDVSVYEILKMQISYSLKLNKYTICYAISRTVFKENFRFHNVNKSYKD